MEYKVQIDKYIHTSICFKEGNLKKMLTQFDLIYENSVKVKVHNSATEN